MSHLCLKKCLLFTDLGQGLSQKFAFSYFLSQFYELADKMLTLSNKKSTFVLVSGFLVAVFPQFCSNIVWKVAFSLKRRFKLTLSPYFMLNDTNLYKNWLFLVNHVDKGSRGYCFSFSHEIKNFRVYSCFPKYYDYVN